MEDETGPQNGRQRNGGVRSEPRINLILFDWKLCILSIFYILYRYICNVLLSTATITADSDLFSNNSECRKQEIMYAQSNSQERLHGACQMDQLIHVIISHRSITEKLTNFRCLYIYK